MEMNKRIRYLENSLLPQSRRDSMATIFDYNLNKEVPLEESRMSGLSVMHNKVTNASLRKIRGPSPWETDITTFCRRKNRNGR